jgi:hypothetical protein
MTKNSASGVISTVAALDRETRGEYSLLIEARDLGTPVQQATRQVNIRHFHFFALVICSRRYFLNYLFQQFDRDK